ncbi:diguanylate cyclase (GGDEF)-like protein [Rhizobium rosettiformans]|uniref:diguanylate cyclase n=3 Tax=Rhizobium rosettiformans TaxID=1368430 RepID=A0A4S8PTN0_9HYPH|nr:diguanylate cyclase [Hyphomicrobiales bacterium]MBB5276965.1 diguanylate cyclase (GGDEF)-like protein [Rhizobium rosettiformans]MDR7027917.1 diguanylate cyclase (GGDEF)-like protein [Rhizobium rosettiformans]MDR7066481.1 diguanylate cyclase (GGDEF)-like protein [Rhizobium rosettiformans]THV34777.1 diguanylate cyclase [Rhizobium rosettiformans W3]
MYFSEQMYARQGALSAKRAEQGRILIIEDSRSVSSLMRHRLEKDFFCQVTQCASADVFRDIIRRGDPFDVAVVDLNLPGASDGEVLDAVIAEGIPAVVFTADFNRDLRDRLLQKGVADYHVKNNENAIDMVVSSVLRLLGNRDVGVLVVDDVPSARSMLADLLRVQKFQVYEAATGYQALDILARQPHIELVITDYHMPDMDGYELTRRIRREHNSDRLRIIGISSSADRLLSASFLKGGANDFVYRPYVVEELQCRIQHNIETLAQLRQLRVAAFSDYLTGLPNRRYFFDEGPAQVAGRLERREACCIAMLDIDHFKKLNDTYGHEIGDRVLQAVGAKLARRLEGSGHLLARLGGEEFSVLMLGLDVEAGAALCETLRADIESLRVALDDQDLNVTISIGLAEIAGRESFSNYLAAADQLLYLAKSYGRNRVYSETMLS